LKLRAMNGPTGEQPTVLIVDDDHNVRSLAAQIVRMLDFWVIEANGAEAALKILREPIKVDLLFTDVTMPGLSGLELAHLAKQLRPDLKVLYTSAHFFGGADNPALRYGPLIAKPWKLEQLREVMDTLIETYKRAP
jgi:DNA-binding NtrC family response regulator